MWMTKAVISLAALLVAQAVTGAPPDNSNVPMQVELEFAAGYREQRAAVELVAEPLAAGDSRAAPHRIVMRAGPREPTEILLDKRFAWKLTAHAEGHWGEPAIWRADQGRKSITLRLWPAARVTGRVVVPKGERLPTRLAVQMWDAPRVESGTQPGQVQLSCPVHPEGGFACTVPAGRWDLRLRAEGFVSVYRWGKRLTPRGALSLPRLALRQGASIVGSVAVEGGALDPHTCVVTAAPVVLSGATRLEDWVRRDRLELTERVDERGQFHFEGIPAGSYRVTARQPGFADVVLSRVEVRERAETQIQDPLWLKPPVPLEVRVRPATDPDGDPWRLRLLQRSAIPSQLDQIARGKVDTSGHWRRAHLPPGAYIIDLTDSRGASYAWEEIVLSTESGFHDLRLPLIEVEGGVTLGDEPLAAELQFRGGGATKVQFTADEGGRFRGVLSHAGDWDVDVKAETPSVATRVFNVEVPDSENGEPAEVVIRLPETHLRGKVVDEEGKPQARAVVHVFQPLNLGASQVRTEADGSFEFHGLEPGQYRVEAQALPSGEMSDEEVVTLQEDVELPRLRLVVRERMIVEGRVVADGHPVPGASVQAEAELAPGVRTGLLAIDKVQTGADGSFRLRLPADAQFAGIHVMSPGFALTALRVAVPRDESLVIPVSVAGGTLRLRWEDPVDWQDSRQPKPVLFVAENPPLAGLTLLNWSKLHGFQPSDFEFVVPAIQPGPVQACLLTVEETVRILLTAEPPSEQNCTSATLSPNSELSLNLPSP